MLDLDKLKRSDESEFKKLVDMYSHQILNTCFYTLGNRNDAEDTTQDVFKAIYSGIQSFKGDSKLKTWIYKITLNKCNEFIRKKRTHKRNGIQIEIGNAKNIESDFQPDIQFILKEEEINLWRAVQRLPEQQKTIVTLYALNQLSYQEIAESLDLSISAVESSLFRARTTLKKEMKP